MKNEIEDQILLSDAALLDEVKRLTAGERHATARLIAALGELDARRLYLGEGCAGMTRLLTRCRRRLGQLLQLQVLELLSRLPVRSHSRTRIYFTPGGTGLVFIGDCALRRLGLVPEF